MMEIDLGEVVDDLLQEDRLDLSDSDSGDFNFPQTMLLWPTSPVSLTSP